MAYGVIQFGKKRGQICRKCEHPDCAQARGIVESICRYCKEPIGADHPFCYDGPDLVHFFCLEDAVIAEAEAPNRA